MDALALISAIAPGTAFFSTVDHRPQIASFERLQQHRLKPLLLAYADNEQDHSAMFPWAEAPADGAGSLADELRQLLDRAVPRTTRLEGVLLCANGYAPRGELAWLNRALFHRDPRAACERLRPDFGELFVAPLPGDVVTLRRGKRVAPATQSSWINTLPEEQWPQRGGGARPTAPFAPATGRLRLEDAERAALARALDELARFLYASSLFMEMYLLDAETLRGRRPSCALRLLEGEDIARAHASGGTVWSWDASGCRFAQESGAPSDDEFVAGVRCWASDLLAVLEVAMPAASLTVGRMSGWNAAPSRLRFDLPNLLHMYCHPLRAPDRFLALYRGLQRGGPPLIRAARAAPMDPDAEAKPRSPRTASDAPEESG